MTFEDHYVYPTSRERLLQLFTQADAIEAKYAALGAWDIEPLEVKRTRNHVWTRYRYRIRSEAPLPAFALKLAGETSVVTVAEEWNLTTGHGHVDIDIKGVPASISADLQLSDDGGSCIVHRQWTAHCRLPLVGGALERLIGANIQGKVAREHAATVLVIRESATA